MAESGKQAKGEARDKSGETNLLDESRNTEI
jgi:hypothetical protein